MLVALGVETYYMPLTETQFKTCRFHGSLSQKGSRPLRYNASINKPNKQSATILVESETE